MERIGFPGKWRGHMKSLPTLCPARPAVPAVGVLAQLVGYFGRSHYGGGKQWCWETSWEESAQGTEALLRVGGYTEITGRGCCHVMCKTASGFRLLFCSVPHLVLGVQPDTRLLGNGPQFGLSRMVGLHRTCPASRSCRFSGAIISWRGQDFPGLLCFLEFNPV